jgi:hypothetical protein
MTVLAALVLAAGCSRSIQVQTMAAPEAAFVGMHSFSMLAPAARQTGEPAQPADDPMINNSIANRALRGEIVKALTDLGYAETTRNADFQVAFYASARERLDVSAWDYGYPFFPGWVRPMPPAITTYTEGTVIIDVLRPRDRMLLWRGHAHTELTENPTKNVERLGDVARAVVAKFPRSTVVSVAGTP